MAGIFNISQFKQFTSSGVKFCICCNVSYVWSRARKYSHGLWPNTNTLNLFGHISGLWSGRFITSKHYKLCLPIVFKFTSEKKTWANALLPRRKKSQFYPSFNFVICELAPDNKMDLRLVVLAYSHDRSSCVNVDNLSQMFKRKMHHWTAWIY